MSKPSSGHFNGTTGKKIAQGISSTVSKKCDIIAKKKSSLDLREHPTKYKQMSSKKLKKLREKETNRTITKEEYKHKEWQRRLKIRRNEGIRQFWEREQFLIKSNLPTTRNWSAEQRKAILAGKRPKFKGLTLDSHHTYSVAKYPHLANRGELIYPVTKYEHRQGWHGGNMRNSLPGKPINKIEEEF